MWGCGQILFCAVMDVYNPKGDSLGEFLDYEGELASFADKEAAEYVILLLASDCAAV